VPPEWIKPIAGAAEAIQRKLEVGLERAFLVLFAPGCAPLAAGLLRARRYLLRSVVRGLKEI
jgi:hypothetical protein